MVRIRMKRMGRRHRPFYRITAIERRNQRDGRIIERLGWYDPMAKDESKKYELDTERVRHWLDHGAQPSETVADLLARIEVIDPAEHQAARDKRFARKRARIVESKAQETAAKATEEAGAKVAAEAEPESTEAASE